MPRDSLLSLEMTINSIKLINFKDDLTSADIIIYNEKQEGYMARVHHIDILLNQLQNGKQINSSTNYLYIPNSLVVDEINEDNMFEMVNNLLDEGDFFNVFHRI